VSGSGGNGWAPAAAAAEAAAAPPRHPHPSFAVRAARPAFLAAGPTLVFDLDLVEPSGRQIFTIALSIQIAIEPAQRRYDPATRERLIELLGDPRRIGSPTRTVPWTQVDVLVKPFAGATSVAVPIPCNYDLEIAATNYFRSVSDGEVPLVFHFNGSVYYEGEDGRVQIVQISWEESADYRMPVAAWRDAVSAHYPNRGWIPAGEETIERLRQFKLERGLPSYEAALERLLDSDRRPR
jgi:uncharacterized protein DUF6084